MKKSDGTSDFDPDHWIFNPYNNIISDEKAFTELEKECTRDAFVKDLRKVSRSYQTSALEAFHSLVIQFAPKSTHFSYLGMYSRYVLSSSTLCHITNCSALSPFGFDFNDKMCCQNRSKKGWFRIDVNS